MRRRGDGQLRTQLLVARGQRELERRALAGGIDCLDRADLQVARVEHEILRLRVLPVELQRGVAGQLALAEVQLEIEVQVGDPYGVRLGVGMRVGGEGHDGERHGEG